MEYCIRCKISESETTLYNSIYDARPALICERCAIIENIPLLDKSKIMDNSNQSMSIKEKLERLREIPSERKLELMDYFHWELMRARRRKGITQEKLAEAIGESVLDIDKLERAIIPDNAERIVRKIERFLGIRIRKIDEREEIALMKSRPPVLLDEEGKILDNIPEPTPAPLPEPEIIEEEPKEKVRKIIVFPKQEQDTFVAETEKHSFAPEISGPRPYEMPYSRGRASIKIQPVKQEIKEDNLMQKKETEKPREQRKGEKIEEEPIEIIDVESGDLDIQKAKMSNTRIADLREIHKQKLQITKQEKINEARKIEDKQKLIEARKEELRLIKEKQSKDIDKRLGGLELLKKPDEENNKILQELDEEEMKEDFEAFEND